MAAATFPDASTLNPAVHAFFQRFYALSDTPDAHEEYAREWIDDGVFVLASATSTGPSEILEKRKNMWQGIRARRHVVSALIPHGAQDAHSYVLYGTVDYWRENGERYQKDWAARAKLDENSGRYRFSYYQVYLDTGTPGKLMQP